ncbi:hypothetical protein S7335_2499 [Synechococcus sp. PCC 7335]|nr:hypothetical protein S7335_2499 [Synechococcus sp. PCC 7335]
MLTPSKIPLYQPVQTGSILQRYKNAIDKAYKGIYRAIT